jgi:hypothetical protein
MLLNVNAKARGDPRIGAGDPIHGTFCLFVNIIAGEPRPTRRAGSCGGRLSRHLGLGAGRGLAGELGIRPLFLQVHHAVFEIEHLLMAEIPEHILGDAFNKRGHTLTGRIVVSRRLQKIGILREGYFCPIPRKCLIGRGRRSENRSRCFGKGIPHKIPASRYDRRDLNAAVRKVYFLHSLKVACAWPPNPAACRS